METAMVQQAEEALDGLPPFLPISKAAKVLGVSREEMDRWVSDRLDPIKHMKVGDMGNKTLIATSELIPYAMHRTCGRSYAREFRVAQAIKRERPELYMEYLDKLGL